MSFTRFRKAEKSKASSVQSNQDYKDVRQQDNLSNYSHQSQNQYDYRQKVQPQEKPQTQAKNIHKFNNDINNIKDQKRIHKILLPHLHLLQLINIFAIIVLMTP